MAKQGTKNDDKKAEVKPADLKPAESKPVDTKPVDTKPVEVKLVDPKPTEAEKKPDATPAKEKKEGAVEEEEDDEEDIPELEDVADAGAAGAGAAGAAGGEGSSTGKGKPSRNEKKARTALQKLGLKSVPGIWRVTIKKNKNVPFVINKPDVYKSPVSETYIIFGEAKPEDYQTRAQEKAAQALGATSGIPGLDKETPAGEKPEEGTATTATAAPTATTTTTTDDANVDETGLAKSDIELVMQQASVSKTKAVEALRANSGDLINTIMSLQGLKK
jgi:nascent polypeptide-associated complex subunit alpha